MKIHLKFRKPLPAFEDRGTMEVVNSDSCTEVILDVSRRLSLAEIKQFWDAEQAVNSLTAGRLHVEIRED